MISLTILSILVLFLRVYAFRDWMVSLCGLILLTSMMRKGDWLSQMGGIPGLNLWNTLSERNFAERTGWTPDDVRGRLVLEIGRGMGRFADVVLRWGGRVGGVDLSYAVDSARVNLLRHAGFSAPGECLRAADSARIFRPDLQHRRSSSRSGPSACFPMPAAAPPRWGGIAIWVHSLHTYPAQGIEERRDRVLRRMTTRMPSRILYAICRALCVVRLPFRPLWHMLLPSILFHALPRTHRYDSYDWRVLDTFDWYSPRYQFKHSYPEVFRCFGRPD